MPYPSQTLYPSETLYPSVTASSGGGGGTSIGTVYPSESLYPSETLYPGQSVISGGGGGTGPPLSIEWGVITERAIEAGLDRGVLYPKIGSPVAWNGLTGVDESGGDSSVAYFLDGRPYLYLSPPKEFQATLKAYTYPDAFAEIMGLVEVADGMYLDSQMGDLFDLSYRTQIADGINGIDAGYKIHLIYNATVVPQGLSYGSLDDNVNPVDLEWAIQAIPVPVIGYRPTAHVVIDTRHMDPDRLASIEKMLYGDGVSVAPSMPDPQVILDLLTFADTITVTDNGDGTWTVEAADSHISLIGDGVFVLTGVDADFIDDDTYTLTSST